LNVRGNLTAEDAFKILGYKSKEWEANYKMLEGNRTNKALYDAYLKILELEGYDENLLKNGSDNIDISKIELSAVEISKMIQSIFKTLAINTELLIFDAEIDGKGFEKQPAYQLWHLLYAYEDDNSPSGNEKLYELLSKKFGFRKEHA